MRSRRASHPTAKKYLKIICMFYTLCENPDSCRVPSYDWYHFHACPHGGEGGFQRGDEEGFGFFLGDPFYHGLLLETLNCFDDFGVGIHILVKKHGD